ncbi:MAG: hypothetical protein HY596_00695 [Candidatus Omnitrophica bacterium]|nr:hypothetical protein [Candidatus Omnitrophota bacterium]
MNTLASAGGMGRASLAAQQILSPSASRNRQNLNSPLCEVAASPPANLTRMAGRSRSVSGTSDFRAATVPQLKAGERENQPSAGASRWGAPSDAANRNGERPAEGAGK